MKLLCGTTNPAKLDYIKKRLRGLDIELLCLRDMKGEIPEIAETGNTPLENAELKARAYNKAFGIPVLAQDSGLYFENLPEYSPLVHVRNVNGKTLTDEEMTAYYGGLAAKYGDIIARYQCAVCLVADEEHVYTDFGEDLWGNPFIITAKPHPKRVKGFPIDCLSVDISSGRYYYDVLAAENEKKCEEREQNERHESNGYRRVVETALAEIGSGFCGLP